MIMRVALGLALVLAVGCTKAEKKSEDKPKPAATVKTGTVAPDGVRTIEVAASENGYVPDRIPGKPGEKLKLKFTRTIDGECLSQLKTPDGARPTAPHARQCSVTGLRRRPWTRCAINAAYPGSTT